MRFFRKYRGHGVAVLSLYGLQIATLVIPLLLLPFLTRQLGASTWGVLAVQSSLSTLMIMFLEYGFGFGATRRAAEARGDRAAVATVVSNVVVARVLLSVIVAAVWMVVWFSVPLVRQEAAAYWWTFALTLVQGYSPSWFFQSVGRLPFVMIREFGARVCSTALIFGLVHDANEAWMVPALQAAAIALSLTWCSWKMLGEVGGVRVSFRGALRLLREDSHLCVTRFVQGLAPMGNTFLLGVVFPGGAATYAAAERAGNAVRSLLAPVSQVAFPEIVVLNARDPAAARLAVRKILVLLVAGASVMCFILWVAAPLIIRVLFGPEFETTVSVFRLLLVAVPLFGIVQVVGLQWLLPLKFDKSFISTVAIGAVLNVGLGIPLAREMGADGMALGLVFSELAISVGLLVYTEFLGPSRLRLFRSPSRPGAQT